MATQLFRASVFLICVFLVGGAIQPCVGQQPSLDLFQGLSETGIAVTAQERVRLPLPAMAEGQSAAKREEILVELAGKTGWDRFSANSVNAPVAMQLEYIKDSSGERIGHNVHTAFIAYASIATLRDKELMESMFGRRQSSEDAEEAVVQDLTAEELASLGIDEFDKEREGYAKMELRLLNKVVLRGVLHIQKREGPDWLQLYWEMDPRFTVNESNGAKDLDGMVNSWTKLVPNRVGRLEESLPNHYQGCGGYMTVHATGLADDQMLIESHMVLHEPPEWFAGSNLLRSKLPLSLQDSARGFRRKITK